MSLHVFKFDCSKSTNSVVDPSILNGPIETTLNLSIKVVHHEGSELHKFENRACTSNLSSVDSNATC